MAHPRSASFQPIVVLWVHYTRFQNYIALINSGQEQAELPEALFRAVKAEFYGFEAES
ncbi:hypothetical protein NTGBS_490006 [Candidatus Nitrotoga sp. BS]|nr:hypothetical protein NTGBS_490006 [Candidatus Nitrotoga sp. BS]